MSARRWFAPEVVQTSAMDCGPASLKCLLEGFNIPVSYGRLREACQTDVDGTSIDVLEDIAGQLGLDAEQVLIPREHALLDVAGSLPAIVVQRQPDGATHFIVAWRKVGGRVQVMDPSTGRRWPTEEQFLESLYMHVSPVIAADFRAWAETEDFVGPLSERLALLGVPERGRAQRERAIADPRWRGFAVLDAATRLVESLVRSGAVARGGEATRVLDTILDQSWDLPGADQGPIPGRYWHVIASPPDEEGNEMVGLYGAVLVRVRGKKSGVPDLSDSEGSSEERPPALSADLAAALAEPSDQSWRILLRILREDGLYSPMILAASLAFAACGLIIEALLYWGVVQMGRQLALPEARLLGAGALIVFLLLLLVLELPMATGIFRSGRHLEMRLRLAFLAKLPRLAERYFSSRPVSDMAQRSHSTHLLRALPYHGAALLRAVFGLLTTTVALIWLDPRGAPQALLLFALAVLLPLGMSQVLVERDLRVRTHAGALQRFYLDALLGLIPIRAHTAERMVRREHEGLLSEWSIASRAMMQASVAIQGSYGLFGQAVAVWLVFEHVAGSGVRPQALLIAYWAFGLLARGQELSNVLQVYPGQRNVTLRLLEPLGAPDDAPEAAAIEASRATSPVEIQFDDVRVHAGGHAILEDIQLTIPAGAHVAVVGPSGAGKSSLVGLLLGWHQAAAGRVLIDGVPLDGTGLDRLRRETAWVDPAVQIWNRSFLDNLQYGTQDTSAAPSEIIAEAELYGVLERLPEGQQTVLGESGGKVSGGEGQRVRLARAMFRSEARLVLLDEPFRGLDRERRHKLMLKAKRRWRQATMLCVTHDVGETLAFERVLVVEGGRVVEDGVPAELARDPGSRYRALLDAEEHVRSGLWSDERWRRLTLDGGTLTTAVSPARASIEPQSRRSPPPERN